MKVLKVIGKIFAVIFCIVYFFLLTGFMTISFAGNFLSGDYYGKVLEKIDLKTIKMSDLGDFLEGSDLDADATVEDALIKYIVESGTDEEKAIALVENKEVKRLLGKYIGQYVNFNVTGEIPKVEKKDVEDLLSIPDLTSIIGEPTQEDIDKVYNQLNDLVNEIVEGPGDKGGNDSRNETINIISER